MKITKNSLDYSALDKERLNRKLQDHSFPPVLIIDTISFCTLSCAMCPHKYLKRKKGIMEWELYRKIIDEIALKKPDARVWITFAGEGSMLKDLPEKIAYARQAGLSDVVLNTNGTLLTPEFSERLIKAGLNVCMVGIDAATPETYALLRGAGGKGIGYEKIVQNVLDYQEKLAKHGKSDQFMNVQFVQMDENEHEIDEFIDFWNSRKIVVKIKPKVSWINRVDADNLLQTAERLPCYWTCSVMAITDTGMVALCGADLDCATPMGSVVENSIEDIWNDKLKKVRLAHLNSEWNKLPDACKNCRDWQSGYAKYAKK